MWGVTILEGAYSPEATRTQLAAAVGEVLEILQEEEEEETDETDETGEDDD